jgi:hypothetical protein
MLKIIAKHVAIGVLVGLVGCAIEIFVNGSVQ